MSISIPIPLQSLSYAKSLSDCPIGAQSVTLATKLSQLSLASPGSIPFTSTPIRMGGGPRTYPGGVSKWQWKRMQANKAKQLLKARLARERQIYEMRKRAELKAAISELERPWEVVEKPPNLFSVSADEQLKVLADRFQKPGGLDLWSERDGPELFRPDNGLPSMRFFPKGVVHSVKPYGKREEITQTTDEFEGSELDSGAFAVPGLIGGSVEKRGIERKGNYRNSRSSHGGLNRGERSLESVAKEGEKGSFRSKIKKNGNRRNYSRDSEGSNSVNNNGRIRRRRSTNAELGRGKKADPQVFEMGLQNDGVYGFKLDD